eukprot:scaffold14902_cov63-Phaeocystis_antarctica.AAC.3
MVGHTAPSSIGAVRAYRGADESAEVRHRKNASPPSLRQPTKACAQAFPRGLSSELLRSW